MGLDALGPALGVAGSQPPAVGGVGRRPPAAPLRRLGFRVRSEIDLERNVDHFQDVALTRAMPCLSRVPIS